MNRKIYATLDGGPAQWLLVKNRVNPVEPGNEITVRSFAAWVEPRGWVRVKVISAGMKDGFTTYHAVTKTVL